ncbi:hypothetical protein [Actinomadura coerulea]|uniref:hypothetical protein n=1 Tax=Actinomadura coerulea TaxID=46159 RepID=UPI003447A56D
MAREPESVSLDQAAAIAAGGNVGLGGRMVLAAEILRGRRVGIRTEPATLMFYDLQTRELLRNPTQPVPDAAEAVVYELAAALAGFAPGVDPADHERMRAATAIMLARLWSAAVRHGPGPAEKGDGEGCGAGVDAGAVRQLGVGGRAVHSGQLHSGNAA